MKWTSQFIEENSENWAKEREKQDNEAQKELDEWRKLRRMEKMEILKKNGKN